MESKVNLIANNVIELTVTPGKPGDKSKGIRPTPPVTKTLKPGTRFSVPKDEEDFYTKGGKPAARLAKDQTEPKLTPAQLAEVHYATGTSEDTRVDPEDLDEDGTEGNDGVTTEDSKVQAQPAAKAADKPAAKASTKAKTPAKSKAQSDGSDLV